MSNLSGCTLLNDAEMLFFLPSKAYVGHLHPEVDALFQRPKDISLRFDPEKDKICFEKKVLGHNTFENLMRSMTERASILPYYTDHPLRATTVTVLSSNYVETW